MDTLGLVSVAGLFFILWIVYFVHVQLRRRKYRQIAHSLGAEYHSQGLFKTGKIAGASDHRKYTVENVVRSRATWTSVEMPCLNKGISLHIHGRFFKTFPNWKYAFTRGDRTERVFVTHIALQNVGVLLPEKYRVEVQALFQENALVNYALLRKAASVLNKTQFLSPSVAPLKKLEVIRQVLSVLAKIADRIESEPIV